MRKILSSPIFRVFLCAVLICALLINVSPIKAKALAVEVVAGFVAVSGIVAIAAIFQGLGIMSGSDSTTFNSRVNECFQYIQNTTSYIVGGFIQVFGSMASLDAGMVSYLPRDLIQSVWDWISFSGLVGTVDPSLPANSSALFSQRLEYAKTFPYALMIQTDSSVLLAISQSPFVFDSEPDGDLFFRNATNSKFQTCASASNFEWYTRSSAYYSPGTITKFGTSYLGAEEGLVLGQFQSSKTGTDEEILKIEICPIYVDWSTGEISQKPPSRDNPDPIPYWPVGIPSTDYEDVVHQDQQQAQSGQTGIDFETSTDPDTGGGSGDGTGTGTGTDTGTGTNTGTSSWTPPSDMGKFTLDLKQYFPFCIPFDLYAFFTCLNAEPVAPVIEWIIPLPGGKTYPFEIDLSVFDSVAQTLRRMQLLLFCVGLAFKTRDLIKG